MSGLGRGPILPRHHGNATLVRDARTFSETRGQGVVHSAIQHGAIGKGGRATTCKSGSSTSTGTSSQAFQQIGILEGLLEERAELLVRDGGELRRRHNLWAGRFWQQLLQGGHGGRS